MHKEFTAMLAKYAPEKYILDMLSKALEEYRANPNDKTKMSVGLLSMVVALRFGTETMSLEELLKNIDKMDKLDKLFVNSTPSVS